MLETLLTILAGAAALYVILSIIVAFCIPVVIDLWSSFK